MVEISEAYKNIIDKQEALEKVRKLWEPVWEEIATYAYPAYKGKFGSQTVDNSGQNYLARIFDTTAIVELEHFVSVLYSLITPRSSTYQTLTAEVPEIMQSLQAKQFYADLNDTVLFYRNQEGAGFNTAIQDYYRSAGAFGTMVMMVDRTREPGENALLYKPIPLYEVYIDCNYQGKVHTVHRKFMLTASQMVEQFGEDAVGDKILAALKRNSDEKFEVLHAVFPRRERNLKAIDSKNKAFASVYLNTTEKKIMREGGYNTFPYIVDFYKRNAGETYGRSPIMDVLPNIKVANRMQKDYIEMLHRLGVPTYLIPMDSVLPTSSFVPGAIARGGLSPEGQKLIQTMDVQSGQLPSIAEGLEQERNKIKEALLVPWFQILTKTPEMTATEYLGRENEKSVLVSPALGRIQANTLPNLIARELDLLSFERRLPDVPGVLVDLGVSYTVMFEAPVNKLEKAQQAGGIMRAIESLSVIANVTQDPTFVSTMFNKNRLQAALGVYYSVDPRVLNNEEEKQAIEQAKMQQAQVQQMIQAAPSAAALMKVAKEPAV